MSQLPNGPEEIANQMDAPVGVAAQLYVVASHTEHGGMSLDLVSASSPQEISSQLPPNVDFTITPLNELPQHEVPLQQFIDGINNVS